MWECVTKQLLNGAINKYQFSLDLMML